MSLPAVRRLSVGLALLASVGVSFSSTSAVAAEFKRSTTNAGVPLRWNVRLFQYQVATRTFADSAQIRAVDAAVASWARVAEKCSSWRFERGPDIDVPLIGYRKSEPNQNVVVMRTVDCADAVPKDDPCLQLPIQERNTVCANKYQCWFDDADKEDVLAVTLTTFITRGDRAGLIVDADIELNAARGVGGAPNTFTTVDSPPCRRGDEHTGCVANDVQNVMTHELGHALGFEHVDEPGSTMERGAVLGELQKRQIDLGTETGFCSVYEDQGISVRAINTGTGALDSGCHAAGAGAGLVSTWFLLPALGLLRRRRPSTRMLRP